MVSDCTRLGGAAGLCDGDYFISQAAAMGGAHAMSGNFAANLPDSLSDFLSDSINQFGAFCHSAPSLTFLYSAWAYPARCVAADTIRSDIFPSSYPDAS